MFIGTPFRGTFQVTASFLFKDLIILTAGSQVLSLFWDWFWLLLVLAPLRLVIMLWTNVIAPWVFQPAEEDEQSDKKQKKMERKMKRSMR